MGAADGVSWVVRTAIGTASQLINAPASKPNAIPAQSFCIFDYLAVFEKLGDSMDIFITTSRAVNHNSGTAS